MTTPRDPDLDNGTREPARSVETFDDRAGARTPATMGVALFVLLAVLALIAIFMVIGLAQ